MTQEPTKASGDATRQGEHEWEAVTIARPSFFARVCIWQVRQYQRWLSPLWGIFLGPNAGCRFYPTCSHYTIQAIRVHGALKGILLGAWRILRCSPLSKGGEDPVPLPRKASPSCVRR